MEQFKGSLASYRLQLLMPALFEGKRLEGTLRVERGAIRRAFLFRDGNLISASSSEPSEHLAQVLVDLRILDADRAAAAFEGAEGAGLPYGTFLVERCFVELPRLMEALEHKAREGLFDCYEWESGEVEFTPGPPPLTKAIELRLGVGGLHRDALARQREWASFRELFPHPDTTFCVYRQFAVEGVSEEEEALLELADHGASLSELLASRKEGPLAAARWLLHLYRRGALAARDPRGPKLGSPADLGELLGRARTALLGGHYEQAVALAAQVLERAPVAEAHALYREAELGLTIALSDELLSLDGALVFEPVPRPLPSSLTATDLYLYSKLRSSRSIRQALRSVPMGELGASRAMRRLMAARLIRLAPQREESGRKTDPYGTPAVTSP